MTDTDPQPTHHFIEMSLYLKTFADAKYRGKQARSPLPSISDDMGGYSDQLQQLVSRMLERNDEERISAADIKIPIEKRINGQYEPSIDSLMNVFSESTIFFSVPAVGVGEADYKPDTGARCSMS